MNLQGDEGSSRPGPGAIAPSPGAQEDFEALARLAWSTSHDKFAAVHQILDWNRIIIKEIDTNHEQGSPQALEHNVLLINKLDLNIQKVAELYQELSEVFLQTLQRKTGGEGGDNHAQEPQLPSQ